MISWPAFATALASPLTRLNRRAPWLERRINAVLGDTDLALVREACRESGKPIGAYYHWYLQKWLVRRCIGRLDRNRALTLIRSVDRTNYDAIDRALVPGRGALLAVPHHGHYVFAIIALAEHLRQRRKTFVFYGEPGTHPGNEVFDALHAVVFAGIEGVEVIHDTRQGLARAMRGLKDGGAVVIMPDAFREEENTVLLPFCGRWLGAMQGSAILARKTGAVLLPAVARQCGIGMAFETVTGVTISNPAPDPSRPRSASAQADYNATRTMFESLESVMASDLIHWQFVRQHMLQPAATVMSNRDELVALADAIDIDPLFAAATQTIDLRPSTFVTAS